MNTKYIAPLAFLGLMLAALFASLSDTDRARLINTAKAQAVELAQPSTEESEIEEDDTQEDSTELADTAIELCTETSGLAEVIMRNRQSGVPMSAMVAKVPSDSLAMHLIVDAYVYPRMSLAENQENYIRDFADEAMLDCLKQVGDLS